MTAHISAKVRRLVEEARWEEASSVFQGSHSLQHLVLLLYIDSINTKLDWTLKRLNVK